MKHTISNGNRSRPNLVLQRQPSPRRYDAPSEGITAVSFLPVTGGRHPGSQIIDRQLALAEAGQLFGNQHVQKLKGGLRRQQQTATTLSIQRQPEGWANTFSEAATQAATMVSKGDPQSIVRAKLEEFLQRFSNIPVQVPVEADSKSTTTTVFVHPPYFLNTIRTENSRKRLEKAKANRKAATGKENKAPVKASSAALTGKTTPEEMQRILQEAVYSGKIKTPRGKKHLDGEDLRKWLIKYGIGIDCSGFVSQALNEVMAEMHEHLGMSTEALRPLHKGSGQLKGGSAGFAKVKEPRLLQPGDTVHTPGHIQIITHVEQTTAGIEYTTAESHSGKTDAGPDRAVWRFPDGTKFDKLMQFEDGKWQEAKVTPTFGRYQALAQIEQELYWKD
jgi:hypothetical protein